MPFSRDTAYATAGAILLAVALAYVWPSRAGTDSERAAVREGRTVITYWDRSTGHEHEMRQSLVDEFNATQDDIYVRMLPIGKRFEKLLTAIASGAPPDLCSLDGHVLAQLAPQGCFLPLDDLIAEHDSLRGENFFPHTWKFVHLDGRTYGIPTSTDAYCLLWNKDAFRQAGLDPEQPPRTLDELVTYAQRLTVRKDGAIERIGFVPWMPWDLTVMWFGMFNADIYDRAQNAVAGANNPRAIAALEWMRGFTIDPAAAGPEPHQFDPEDYLSFRQLGGAYASANNAFYTGRVAMITDGEWQVTFTGKYAPDLDWGAAPIPQPAGAEPRAYSPPCLLDAIPAGCKHPEAAKRFLAWFYTPRPNGGTSPVSDYCHMIHNFPCRREEALQPRFSEDPKMRIFINELLTKPAVSTPVMSCGPFYDDTLAAAREFVVFRKSSPEEAVAKIEADINDEIVRIDNFLEHQGS